MVLTKDDIIVGVVMDTRVNLGRSLKLAKDDIACFESRLLERRKDVRNKQAQIDTIDAFLAEAGINPEEANRAIMNALMQDNG